MPQYTNPLTGKKTQLPYGPGGGQGGGQGIWNPNLPSPGGVPGDGPAYDPNPGGSTGPNGPIRPPVFQWPNQPNRPGFPGWPHPSEILNFGAGGGAGTQQFPTDPGLPPGTQTNAPQPPTDRSSSLHGLSGQYNNYGGGFPWSQTFQGQSFIDQPDVYMPDLPGGGVGPPTSRSTGQPYAPPPNSTWNPEGRWDTTPGVDGNGDGNGGGNGNGNGGGNGNGNGDGGGGDEQNQYQPGPDPSTPPSPRLSGINDLLESIQTRDTAREARQAPYFNMLSQRLGELSQPVTGEGPEADAIRLATQRAAEKQRSALAAQMAGLGLGTSGAMEGGQAGIDQWQGEANAMQIAGLMQGQRQLKSQELQNLLGMAIQSGDVEAERNLRAQLHGEQLKLQQGQFGDDLQYKYDVLGPSLGLQSQRLGQDWLLGLLGQMG